MPGGDAALAVVSLLVAVALLVPGCAKVLAARSDPDATLRITASVLLLAALVFVLSAPPVYTWVCDTFDAPGLPSLLVYVITLLCVGHAHLLTLLWHPRRREPEALRRSLARWVPAYAATVAAMVALYGAADLSGPAHPLSWATEYAHVPAILALHIVCFSALTVGTTVTVRLCRGPDGVIALPARPEIAHGLRFFALAVAFDIGYAVGTLTAVVLAATGYHRLDFLVGVGFAATVCSALSACYGLAKPALAARRGEHRDHQALRPLWETVVAAVDARLILPTGHHRLWHTRFALVRRLVEIRDGTRTLRPWMRAAPAEAVRELAGQARDSAFDLEAAQAAATLKDAAARFHAAQAAETPVPPDADLAVLPGEDTPAADERAHLVTVARHLDHPIVAAALERVRAGQADPLTAGG